MPPSILYKYRSFEKYTILGLINKTYWLPKPYQLNDPFDAQIKPIHKAISETEFANELKAFLVKQKKINQVDFEYQNVESLYVKGKPSHILSENVKSFSRSVEQIADEIGVLSLSEINTNSTMWSHYGDEHRGICIGYKSSALLPLSGGSSQTRVVPVTYKPKEELFRNAYFLYVHSNMGADVQMLVDYVLDLFAQKTDDWQYEKEWRLLAPNLGGTVIEYEKNMVQTITFGLRTTVETKKTVKELLPSEVQYYQTVRHPIYLGLIVEPMSETSEYWHSLAES
ncbi:DUF2971 domain-containing protein [Vibrio coralliirubri]|uniref:DUF2971 domain-containing protein n=1 Tax=Vibrio coralliirubri TaxID=1516159 RepID=UPI000638543D|nr:DUF2971 domain-containing protein [Vibrio coralliirubri]CDT46229.1 hypothetical protein VCR29J2_30102 [Vibrio coralliirubri]